MGSFPCHWSHKSQGFTVWVWKRTDEVNAPEEPLWMELHCFRCWVLRENVNTLSSLHLPSGAWVPIVKK